MNDIYQCSDKYWYSSFNAAARAAKNQHRRRDIISKPYKCKYCGCFHIGQSMGNKINKKLLAMCDCVV